MIELTTATVTSAPTYDASVDGYTATITTPTFQADDTAPQDAIIVPSAHGSVALPQEGARVIVAELPRRAYILGAFPHKNDGQPRVSVTAGERVIGTGGSDARVRLTPSGDVIINDGGTRPVTDVDFTNETLTRADNVFVPSQ